MPSIDDETSWIADQPGVAFDAALLAMTLGLARRPPGLRDGAVLAAALARRPGQLARPLATLAGEGVRIARGKSLLEPWRKDRRYADRAWRENPVFRSLAQGHAAIATALETAIDGAALDPGRAYRVRLALDNAVAALAPTNFPLTNPAAMKAVIDTGGASLAVGACRLAADMRAPPRLPSRSDPSELKLGTDVAATPGAVVLRTAAMELLQYAPTTEQVHSEPLLVVPSLVNKYYLTDLSPGRSQASEADSSRPSAKPLRSMRFIARSADARVTRPVGLAGSSWSRTETGSVMLASRSLASTAAAMASSCPPAHTPSAWTRGWRVSASTASSASRMPAT